MNRADSIVFWLAAICCEASEIMAPDQTRRCCFHPRQIQGAGKVPHPAVFQRRNDWTGPDSIAINLSKRGEASMKRRTNDLTSHNPQLWRKQCVERHRPTNC